MIFMLMINIAWNDKVYATEEPVPETAVEGENLPPTTEEVINKEETIENMEEATIPAERADAVVVEIGEIKEFHTDDIIGKVQEVKVEILDGMYETKEFTIDYIFSYGTDTKNDSYQLKVGDKVKVQITKDETGNAIANIEDVVRSTSVIIMVGILFLSILFIFRKQAIKPILSLLAIIVCLYFLLIKSIYAGYNAILMTLMTSFIITLLHSWITIGMNKKTVAVVLGTFCSMVMIGIISIIFIRFSKLSGMREDTIMLSMDITDIKFYFKDLIFAGIVMASSGICMSMAISLVSKMEEAKSKTEDMSWKQLFETGMNIGGELIGTRVNALVLTYIGSSLIILFMFLGSNLGIGEIGNKEIMAETVMSAVTGSMGILFTVPITSIIYSFLSHRKTIYKTTSENKVDGNRSLKL